VDIFYNEPFRSNNIKDRGHSSTIGSDRPYLIKKEQIRKILRYYQKVSIVKSGRQETTTISFGVLSPQAEQNPASSQPVGEDGTIEKTFLKMFSESRKNSKPCS